METKASSVFLLLTFTLTAFSSVSRRLGSKVDETLVSFGGYHSRQVIQVRGLAVAQALATVE
jgi:hypothetical protein